MSRRPEPKPDPDHPGRYLRNGASAKAGLNRGVLANRWSDIHSRLEYKTHLAGTRLVRVDPAYTSQTCNRCGHVAKENRESQAVFRCARCGHEGNADINAARNILDRALKPNGMGDAESVEGHPSNRTRILQDGPVETPTPATCEGRVSKQEKVPHTTGIPRL